MFCFVCVGVCVCKAERGVVCVCVCVCACPQCITVFGECNQRSVYDVVVCG